VLLGTDVIVTTPPGYTLGAAWVDAHEFERLLGGKTLDEASAKTLLAKAGVSIPAGRRAAGSNHRDERAG
jgi:hypothetical protein